MASEMNALLAQLEASYGPGGRPRALKVEGSEEGQWTLTSRSYTILKWFPAKDLGMKVSIGALLNLISNSKDCGKFASILFLRILRSSIDGSSLPASRHTLSSILHQVMGKMVEYLDSEECVCKVKVDLSSAATMLALIQSSIRTCSSLCLGSEQLKHLSHLTLKAFVGTLPTESSAQSSLVLEPLLFMGVPGRDVEHSYLLQGILVEVSDVTLGDFTPPKIPRKGSNGDILSAVFNISLAGDVEGIASEEQFLSSAVHTGWGPGEFEGAAVVRMKEIAAKLIDYGVGFVGCQKVIHPVVKQLLRRKGIVVVDRLSLAHISSVCSVTNGEVISTTTTSFSKQCLGALSHIEPVSIGKKRYLHLRRSSSLHHTMVLTANSRGQLEDLQANVSSTVHLLRSTLTHPWALCGGGCTETVLAHQVQQLAIVHPPPELKCSSNQYKRTCVMIAQHLEGIASSLDHQKGITLVDDVTHHCWSLPSEEFTEPIESGAKCPTQQCSIPIHCNCGHKKLSQLCPDTKWRQLGHFAVHTNVSFNLASGSTTNVQSERDNIPLILDSYAAKRLSLLSVRDLLSNMVLVSGVIRNHCAT